MLGHPTGADKTTITTMMAELFLTKNGMLAGEPPCAPHGSDTIVGRGGVPANFR
jgi:hypothetical protein